MGHMTKVFLLSLWTVGLVRADLRIASHPRNGYGINQQGSVRWQREKLYHRYMIPSVFAYKGLKYPGGQKYNNYDNFLRSNIDNEQDNRDFDTEAGRDHLPFRTLETGIDSVFATNRYDGQVPRPKDLRHTVEAGDSVIVPLRWNNPHASEMEVNVWIFKHGAKRSDGEEPGTHPIVIPIRKPSCSGEGHQDNVIAFTIPKDFSELSAKIPGFKGCNADNCPRARGAKDCCVLQIYSHSVESRQYAIGFPIIITGHNSLLEVDGRAATNSDKVEAATKDPWMDLTSLREICRPANDPDNVIPNAVPRWSRMVSDVYTHAYMNSDFSPYSGQQQESISRNLQASAINKMVTGNRGELGASILPRATYNRIEQLQSLEDRIYKNYEALANKVIKSLDSQMQSSGELDAGIGRSGSAVKQPTASCFRCAEGGSTTTKRQETNTYIPSFQVPSNLLSQAKRIVPSKYQGLFTSGGIVQIYAAALTDLWPFFFVSHPYGIIYQEAMLKNTLKTFPHSTRHIKQDANGKKDKGVAASLEAKKHMAESVGCPFHCLNAQSGWQPLVYGSSYTSVSGECERCTLLFANFHKSSKPKVTALAAEISKRGLPGGMGVGTDLAPYPDTDGSPRVGRPIPGGQATVPPRNSTWDLDKGVPTAAPTPPPTPAPTPAPTEAPTDAPAPTEAPGLPKPPTEPPTRRRGKGGKGKGGKGGGEGDVKPTRRRRNRRRRKGKGKAADAGLAQMHMGRRGDAETHDWLDDVLGDVEPLPVDEACGA